jgi:hypothetical protein
MYCLSKSYLLNPTSDNSSHWVSPHLYFVKELADGPRVGDEYSYTSTRKLWKDAAPSSRLVEGDTTADSLLMGSGCVCILYDAG